MKDTVTQAASITAKATQHRKIVEELLAEPWPVNDRGVFVARWSVLMDTNAAIKQLEAIRDLVANAHWWPTPADYTEEN